MPSRPKARRLEYVDLDALVPAPQNPKAHDGTVLAASLGRFGYVEPIVRDERTGRLVSGHGRLESLRTWRDAGRKAPEGVRVSKGRWLLPVVAGWASRDDQEADAALVALNRIGERGGWKRDVLAQLLTALSEDGPGLDGVGFDTADLDDLMASLQEDQAAATLPPAPPVRNQRVRSMVLDYPLADYERLVDVAARARAAHGVSSNAELFLALLRERARG